MIKNYGITSIKSGLSDSDKHLENLRLKGFTVVKDLLIKDQLNTIRALLDEYNTIQENEFGRENMMATNEMNMVRAPLQYDPAFIELITNKEVLELVRALIGQEVLLHLQNGIVNKPNQEHHQSSWHRDLPYQEYIISKPLGVSVFYCIDDFTKENGGTILLPYSHRSERLPSESFVIENQLQMECKAGSAIIFDCMVYHKAGYNKSSEIRRGINNVFVAPLLKQQIDLPKLLKGKYADSELLNMLLGYKYEVLGSTEEYRLNRLKRSNRNE